MTKPKKTKSEKHLQKGHAHWFDGKPKQALAAYKKATAKLAPDAPVTHQIDVKSAYALCLCEIGDFEDALVLYPELHRFCVDNGLVEIVVLRQWAKALEQTGDFRGARQKYEMIVPDAKTSAMDTLKWNHALGLLNWRDGRLSEARANLKAATELMPADPKEAVSIIGVLGNDALLSLELDDQPRALRLADQMFEIHEAFDGTTLSGEINLVRVQAALANWRGDLAEQVAILRTGVELIETQAPEDWMRRLDLASDYVAALVDQMPSSNAIEYLATLCQSAPDEFAWIGRFMLARLQMRAGEGDAAKDNLVLVIATFVGNGSPESEVEIIIELAALCLHEGNTSAAIFLGKLMLKYLAKMAHEAERAELRKILAAGDKVIQKTAQVLRGAGRFEEALAIERILERVERFALIMRAPAHEAVLQDPVPFDPTERQAEGIWLKDRQSLVSKRAAKDDAGAMQAARDMIQTLTWFENTSGLGQKPVETAAPFGQNMRLSFVPSGDYCVVHYRWADRSKSSRIDIAASTFFELVADLSAAVQDHEAWKLPAIKLYHYLIAPIQDELSDVACFEIDASGILGRIPFCLLSTGSECLIQQLRVKYVVNSIKRMPKGTPREGLVHFSASQSGPLATRPNFLSTSAKPALSVTVVAGDAFTRDGLLSGLKAQPAYVSIATHLDTEPTRPDHWALWLGSGEPLYLSDFGAADFDFDGVHLAVLATCSSALEDATDVKQTSLAALVLAKGAHRFVGTLWEISETASARFVEEFWAAFLVDEAQDIAAVLATVQTRYAARANQSDLARTATGGIGERLSTIAPSEWAAFAVFENSNRAQHVGNPQGDTSANDRTNQ
jgi:CHAT domain-containing protein